MKLRVERVCKTYEEKSGASPVLDGVSLELEAGQSLVIMGPSGSGKSTLLNIIGGLDAPSSGQVWLGDLEVTSLKGNLLAGYRNKRVGFVFQDHHLLPQLNVMENVLLPTLAGKAESGSSDRAREILGRVGLSDKLTAFPSELSGGQRQRVAVARALINQPDLLLCDEPTGSLDQETGSAIAELFVELAKTGRVLLVVVTHNPLVASKFGQGMELREGRLQTGRRLES